MLSPPLVVSRFKASWIVASSDCAAGANAECRLSRIIGGETPKVETVSITWRPPYSTPRKPPRLNSWSRPSIRLQHVRKLRVYSKSRKPMRSALSIARSSSSRFASVRKMSEAGKGEWRKSPMWAERWRRRMYDGSSSRW